MYDVDKLLPIFVSILGQPEKFPHNEYYFYCPFCNHHKPRLAINLGIGKWHCWVCDKKGGRLVGLLQRLDVPADKIRELGIVLKEEITTAPEEPSTVVLTLPSEYQPLWKPQSRNITYQHALNYLMGRNMTAADIIRYNLGFCEAGAFTNRVIIPSYDENGKLNFFTGRDFYDNSSLPYKNPSVSKNIIGFESHVNWNYPIVLCEGVFDAFAIKWNAIPLFGKFIPKKLHQTMTEKKVKEVYVALDADAKTEVASMSEHLLQLGYSVHIVEMGAKDPGKIGFAGMQEAIRNAHEASFGDVLAMKLNKEPYVRKVAIPEDFTSR